MKRLLDYDPLSRTQWIFHKDEMSRPGHFVIEEIQDVRPQLAVAAALRNKGIGGAGGHNELWHEGMKRDMVHVALVPNWVITKWFNEEGIRFFRKEDWPRVRAKLNSDDYKWLRTATGRI